MRDRFLRALRGQPVDTTPIWLMRQAGRYLPGYRALRSERSILELATTPELAAQITLEPVRRFDVDAGVIFADITLPLAGLGIEFRIDPGVGPVIPHPLRSPADVDQLPPFDAGPVACVGDAVRGFRSGAPDRPLVGFAGAPFTLAAYLVEGGASREYPETRRLLYRDPATFERLLDRLTEMTISYLDLQADAGVHALQLFDTWAGLLPRSEFGRRVLPHLERIFRALRARELPTIYFSTGSGHLLAEIARCGATAIGVDWRVSLAAARAQLGPAMALQGNLDPAALLGSREALRTAAQAVLDELPDRHAHVFNLGHGVLPETRPEAVSELVEYVHLNGRPVGGP